MSMGIFNVELDVETSVSILQCRKNNFIEVCMAQTYHDSLLVLIASEFVMNQICIVKGIRNCFPCIVEIRGTQGRALVGVPARAVSECWDVAKAQR